MFSKAKPDEDSTSQSRAQESDTALQTWEQEIEQLSSAIGDNSGPEEASPETFQEAHDSDPDLERVAQDGHPVNQPGGGTYLGQLVLAHSIPADLVRMYEGLKTHLKAEIVSVEHLKQGVTVKCTIQDPAMFLAVLPKLPKINEWSFNLS